MKGETIGPGEKPQGLFVMMDTDIEGRDRCILVSHEAPPPGYVAIKTSGRHTLIETGQRLADFLKVRFCETCQELPQRIW